MTRPRSAHRKVIEVSRPLHEWLTAEKEKQTAERGRQVTFTEIIEQLRASKGSGMSDDCTYCQDCDTPIEKWSEFLAHANQGHALTWGVPDGT